MSKPMIEIKDLGKMYRIGAQREKYLSLRDSISGKARHLFNMLLRKEHILPKQSDFWALRNISFNVSEGEAIGIIGRNGAGKSTLLKILSQITPPTEGKITMRGRAASLLEVGTGFHPELSGRENIFLNGAILGMTRKEIQRKFDDIVAFAEVEKFLDTPVKRYSSGMYVRLAFAVAAHLEPEILIVDEVLAVGDAEFQKKCLGKMSDVAKGGRTVLFVSHQMAAVTRLCQRAILLDSGRIVADGKADVVTSQYLTGSGSKMGDRNWSLETAPGDETVRLLSVSVKQAGNHTDSVDIRYPVDIDMVFHVTEDKVNLLCALSFFSDQGQHLFNAADLNNTQSIYRKGMYTATFTIPGNLLAEGVVRICAEVSTRSPVYQIHFLEHDAAAFQVIDTGEPGSVRSGWGKPIPGLVRPNVDWAIIPSRTENTMLEARCDSNL